MRKSKLLIFVLLLSLCLSGCGKTSVYSTPGSSYAEINCIDGLSFYVPFSVTNQATAVTQIVDGMGYDSNSIYSYNNGEDTYILFCMDQLIILAEKGTNFGFKDSANKANNIGNSSIVNTWFEPLGKKLSFEDETNNGIYKIICNVSAEVVITSELFGDYIGKLAVIDANDSEWSLFVGVVAENTSEMSGQQLSLVNAIVESMQCKAKTEVAKTEYDVVIEHNLETTEEVSSPTPIPTENPLQVEENEPKPEEMGESEEDTTNTEDEVIIEDNSEDVTAEDIPTPTPISDDINIEETENTEETSIPLPTSTPVTSLEKKGMNVNNQKTIEKEAGKAYASDEYSMLAIGQCGFYDAYSSEQTLERPVICINNLYTGDEAVRIIKNQITEESGYQYFDAPDGYTWNVVQYDLSYKDCTW